MIFEKHTPYEGYANAEKQFFWIVDRRFYPNEYSRYVGRAKSLTILTCKTGECVLKQIGQREDMAQPEGKELLDRK